ncbi:MAG: MFS transporter [Nanoarchaeota archaeon]
MAEKKGGKRVVVDFVVPRRTLVFATINIFFYFFGLYLIKTMLPIILNERTLLPAYAIVFLFSLRFLSCALYDGFLSALTKKLNLRISAVIGLISLILVFIGFYRITDFFPLVFLFVLLGIFTGLTELTFLNKSQSMGAKGIEMYYFSFLLGTFTAYLLGGFILEKTSVDVLFAVSIVSFLIPLIVILVTSKPHELKKVSLNLILMHKEVIADEVETLAHLRKNTFFIFIVKLMAEGYNSLKDTFIPLIVVSTFLGSPHEVSLVLALTMIPAILIERNIELVIKYVPPIFFFSGHKRRVLGVSLLLLSVSCLLIPFSKNIFILSILMILAMIGFSLINPILNLVILKYYQESYEKENALLHISSQVGKWLVLMLAAGVIYYNASLISVFFIPGIVFLFLFGFLFIDSLLGKDTPKIRT